MESCIGKCRNVYFFTEAFMKGSKILLSALLLISAGAFAMEDAGYNSDADYYDAQECIASNATASTAAVKGWLSGLRERVSNTGSWVKNNTWAKVPSRAQAWESIKNSPRAAKDFVCNLPSAMKKHYLITGGVVATTAAAIILYKLYCDKQKKSKARKSRVA